MYWCPGSQHQHTSSSASARQSIPSTGGMVILKANLPGSPYATTPPEEKTAPLTGQICARVYARPLSETLNFVSAKHLPWGLLQEAGCHLIPTSCQTGGSTGPGSTSMMAVLLAVVACRGGAHLDELATLVTSPPCSTPTKSFRLKGSEGGWFARCRPKRTAQGRLREAHKKLPVQRDT